MTPSSTPTTVSFTYPALQSKKGAYLISHKPTSKVKTPLGLQYLLTFKAQRVQDQRNISPQKHANIAMFSISQNLFSQPTDRDLLIICVHFTLIVAERVQCRSDQIFRNTPLNIVPLPSQDSSKPENASDTPPTSFIPNELNDTVEPVEQSNQEKVMTSQNNVSFGCPFLLWSKQLYYQYTFISRIKRFTQTMDSQQKDPKDAVPSHEFIDKNQARTV